MIELDVKPMSVNDAWQGKRTKTKEYRSYEKECLLKMRIIPAYEEVFKCEKIELWIDYYFSSKGSDIDNPTKPILDILSKKYKFNDNKIYKLHQTKYVVKKCEEMIIIHAKEINET